MKSKEEVKAILNAPGNKKQHAMLERLMELNFSYDELACMVITTMEALNPNATFEQFNRTMMLSKLEFGKIEAELQQLEE